MLQTYLQILRVFGLPGAQVTAVLRAVRDEGCPGLRLLERDGEYAVCIQGSAPTRAMARDYCEKWAKRLRAEFGDALYAEGEVSLAQAALTALLQKHKLLVAADETTGRLLGAALQGLEHSEAAFDFGNQTYLHPVNAKRIVVPPALLQKFPGDLVQAAAGRAATALLAAQADCAVAYWPASVGQGPFVLLCDKRGVVAHTVSPELGDGGIANCLLDLVRRRTLGLAPAAGAIAFRPGHERPMLPVSGAVEMERGDTSRFSLRKPRSKGLPASGGDFEPMLDMDTATRTLGNVMELGGAPARGITFEQGSVPAAPQPAATQRIRRASVPAAPQPAPEAPPVSAPEQPSVPAPQPVSEPPQTPQEPAPSLLDGDIPQFAVPPRPAMPAQELQQAADRLFGNGAEPPRGGPKAPRSHSLAMIEKSERRSRRTVLLILLLFLAILLAGGFALWRYFRGSLGAAPQTRMYGTARFDEQAEAYLANARGKQAGVLGYLAFPGQEGCLVYTPAAAAEGEEDAPRAALGPVHYLGAEQPANTVLDAGRDLSALTDLETLRENSGFTLYTPDDIYRCKVVAVYYADPAEAAPTGFDPAAYGDLSSYARYLDFVLGVRVRSLFDTGVDVGLNAGFITLAGADAQGGRLYVTGRLVKQTESAQLSAAAVEAAPAPLLTAAQYAARGQAVPALAPLLSAQLAQYAADRSTLDEMAAPGQDALPEPPDTDLDALQQQAAQVISATDELLMQGLIDVVNGQSTIESNVNQGASGTLPEQQVDIPLAPAPTPEPTPAPTPEPTPVLPEDPVVDPGTEGVPPESAPTEAPPADPPVTEPPPAETPQEPAPPVAETIDVTMNGVAQTMDLVRCLAMVAQNELGATAPAEAYKAQCVATHCWILSQGGYPAVLGQEPGAAALAAAQEVAHVLVTYNGKVAFTPYFASASTGTASSADVWGGERPWLQAVDSPYDEQFATNWHTSGATSGTARFSRAALLERIKSRLDLDLTDVDPNQWFKITAANQYGWVSQMQIGPDGGPNTTCRGSWFRETLLAGQSVTGGSLRSQCFTFTYDAELDCFVFEVYGYGHGCGMSQWGAVGCARNGWTYAQILEHYFTGTTLATY